jgi:hypothetical protein
VPCRYFPDWKDPLIMPGAKPTKSKFQTKAFDSKALAARKQREVERLPDDGSGKTTVWRVEKREKVEVKSSQIGHFYSGDSYVILYEYKEKAGKDAAFIYFWQGHNSSQDEKADSAIMAMQLDDEMGGYPVQVRYVCPSCFIVALARMRGSAAIRCSPLIPLVLFFSLRFFSYFVTPHMSQALLLHTISSSCSSHLTASHRAPHAGSCCARQGAAALLQDF